VSAASSVTAARRAARLGTGIILDSLSAPARCRELTDAYRAAGGPGPCILVRRAWLGDPPQVEIDSQLAVYRGYAPAAAQQHWVGDEQIAGPSAAAVGEGLIAALHTSGCDALNVRVHVPGVRPEAVRGQIRLLGTDVLPLVRGGIAFA
jgi:alkanesulfonate monooxygenase SsuD/methylene tetrahydromethanopterin reductase-like flavin-dependent oxidoreductase (luciferase family)